jgi:hypothetical protein
MTVCPRDRDLAGRKADYLPDQIVSQCESRLPCFHANFSLPDVPDEIEGSGETAKAMGVRPDRREV